MIFEAPRLARSWQRGSMTRTTCALAAAAAVAEWMFGCKLNQNGIQVDSIGYTVYIYIHIIQLYSYNTHI